MVRNFFKIAFRNILKNKISSSINLIGLSVALASCIVIFLYIKQELSYDNFHANKDRLYRLGVVVDSPTDHDKTSQTPMPAAPAISGVFPEIEKISRVYFSSKDNFIYGEKRIKENNLIFADSTFFEMFSFELTTGRKEDVLAAPFSIVLTEKSAKKYFNDENPIGKQIYINNKEYFTVTGIAKNPPANTHIKFDFVASYSSLTPEFMGWDPSYQWGAYFGNFTYILTTKDADIQNLYSKMKEFTDENIPTHSADVTFEIVFQPIITAHTDTSFESTPEPTLSTTSLIILTTIGGFLLLIACINFINLTTARSLTRVKEIGVRKTIGAGRISLIRQFIGESILFTLFSLIIASPIINTQYLLFFITLLISFKISFISLTYILTFSAFPSLNPSKISLFFVLK